MRRRAVLADHPHQPLRDHVRTIFPTPIQTLRQFLPTRRQDEHQHRVREQLLDLQRPLPVDLQHHIVTLRDAAVDGSV
jgi:hypothetical protein